MKKIVSLFAAFVMIVGIAANVAISAKAASNVTVWFYNSNGWSTVNAYSYYINNNVTTAALGAWPGKAAAQRRYFKMVVYYCSW